MKINRKNDLEYITFDNLEQTGLVKHCFTTRHGGVSTDYWASMNMGFARGEEREPVLQNYKILADRVRYFKEDENGVAAMSRVLEGMRKETARETAIKVAKGMLESGKLTYEEIAKITELTIDEVRALDEKVTA